MDNNPVNEKFYRPRAAKPRGETIQQKINWLMKSWQKIIDDCEADDSTYRKEFQNIHKNYLSLFGSLMNDCTQDEESLRLVVSNVAELLENAWNSRTKNSHGDALGLMYWEVKNIIG